MNGLFTFERLRLLDQAGRELENLKKLKDQNIKEIKYQKHQKLESDLREKAKNLINLYQNILSVGSSQNNDQKSIKNQRLSSRRTHSRSKFSLVQTKIQNNQMFNIILNATINCNIAYIQTNFLNSMQDAEKILINSKQDISSFMQKLNYRKKYVYSKTETIQDVYSERSSISLSKFCTVSKNNQKINNISTPQKEASNELHLTYIRTCMNLVIVLILQNKHTLAVEIFNQMISFIGKLQSKEQRFNLIEYIMRIWFHIGVGQQAKSWKQRMENFRKDENVIKVGERLSVEQAVSLSHFIFNSDLFFNQQQEQQNEQKHPVHFLEILQKAIQVFQQNHLYELAFFTLRHLLQSPISPQLKESYYIQLREMLQSGKLKEDIELQNIESVQCFKSIIFTLNKLAQQYNLNGDKNHNQQNEAQLIININRQLLIIVLNAQVKKVQSRSELTSIQKKFLIQKLIQIKKQQNPQIIQSLLNQNSSQNIISQIQITINKVIVFSNKFLSNTFNAFLTNLTTVQNIKHHPALILTQKNLNLQQVQKNKSEIKRKMVSPSHSKKYLKLISTSIYSENSAIYTQKSQSTTQKSQQTKITSSHITQTSSVLIQNKKILKMIRLCEHGGFLNKRNFNSDGGQIKFIKITHDKIKWSKNPQKIDESTQFYPLKDIKGVIYGKVSPNMRKPCNNSLKEQLCFSLILQKRTMDFFCKDYKQVESWVCGISSILKKQNKEIAGYSPGKMRWRKMFATLRQAFIQPLKMHQRNQYFFQNAYSLIMFKRNGYKLPETKKLL